MPLISSTRPSPAETAVLIADDEELVLNFCQDALEEAEYRCWRADSAKQLLELVSSRKFDVVVADVHFNDDNQLNFLQDLDDQSPRVVLMTGLPSTDSAVRALQHGVVDYLSKPFEAKTLVDAVAKAAALTHELRSIKAVKALAAQLIEASGGVVETAGQSGPASTDYGAIAERLKLRELSKREIEVAISLVRGTRPAHIATENHISTHTVRNHIRSIYKKLDVHSQLELVAAVRKASFRSSVTFTDA